MEQLIKRTVQIEVQPRRATEWHTYACGRTHGEPSRRASFGTIPAVRACALHSLATRSFLTPEYLMLSGINELKGYALHGLDGDLGSVRDFLFDDKYWTIRYLSAETGKWIPNRQVLISPYSLGDVHTDARTIGVSLTKQRILDSPPISSDEPVSRQYEQSFYGYYQYPMYFGGGNMWGAYPYIARDRDNWQAVEPNAKHWDAHLRSTSEVSGYHIQASDDEVGHVHDFIVDDQTWAIRYLVVDTRNWWPGKLVLVAPRWLSKVSWTDSKVSTTLTREQIKDAPAYVAGTTITREYEERLHQHYQQTGYWIDESAAAGHAV
jgi:hypothetical protein